MSDLSLNLYSIETEQALIGSLLIEPSIIPQIVGAVHLEDFHDQRHQAIYTAIMALGEAADNMTVSTELERRGLTQASGGDLYLLDLLSAVPTAINAEQYAKTVADLALRRRVRNNALTSIAKAASDLSQPSDELLDMAQREILKAAGTATQNGLKPMLKVLNEFQHQYEAKHAGENITGIRSGIPTLDEKLRGFRAGRMVTIAGRPGAGKSALMGQIAAHAAMKQNKRVIFFSAEMGEIEVIERIVGNFAVLNMAKAKTHSPEDIAKVLAVQNAIASSGLTIAYIAGWTPARILAECERIRSTKGLDLVVIDYVQILNVPQGKGETRDMSLSAATRQLKQAAGKMGLPIIIGAQLNRDAANGEPQLHQLRETGGLENDSDAVVMLHDVSSMEQPNVLNAYVRKNRDGETGKVELYFDKPHQKISAIARERVNL